MRLGNFKAPSVVLVGLALASLVTACSASAAKDGTVAVSAASAIGLTSPVVAFCQDFVGQVGIFRCPGDSVITGVADNIPPFAVPDTVTCCGLALDGAPVRVSGGPFEVPVITGTESRCPLGMVMTGLRWEASGRLAAGECTTIATSADASAVFDTFDSSNVTFFAERPASCPRDTVVTAVGDTVVADGAFDSLVCGTPFLR
jgi:hypothetical protein